MAVTLPKIYTDHETVNVGGVLFDVRVLTRAEAATLQKMVAAEAPVDQLEITLIAAATDTPEAEVRDWYAATPQWAVQELVEHIKRVSRLDGEAQKSG